MHLVDPHTDISTFTTAERSRLVAYRAAVAAGLYSDWDGSAARTDTQVLAGLVRAEGQGKAETYPFTEEERQALERLREKYAEGGFADDRPAPPTVTPPATDPASAE